MSGQRRPADPRGGRVRAPARTSSRRESTPKPGDAQAKATPTPARTYKRRSSTRLTGRAAVLFIVLTALALTLAWPARAYVDQRRQIAALREQTRATQQRVALLQQQEQQWNDPQYVESQARQRLHFVRPGETAYVVLRPTANSAPAPTQLLTKAPTVPWYTSLWSSVDQASKKS